MSKDSEKVLTCGCPLCGKISTCVYDGHGIRNLKKRCEHVDMMVDVGEGGVYLFFTSKQKMREESEEV